MSKTKMFVMTDNENPIKPLDKIIFFGKEGKQPFQISGMKWKGLYYYIFVNDLQQLLKINERYKSIRKPKLGIEPLREVKLVGGGNIMGYKPFLYEGEQCVCIFAEHLQQLMEINREYKKLLQKGVRKKIKVKPKKKIELKPDREIEEPKVLYQLSERGSEEAKEFKTEKKEILKGVEPKSVKRVRKKLKKRIRRVKRVKKSKKIPRKIKRELEKIKKKIIKLKVTKLQRSKLLKNLKRIFRIQGK